MVRLGGVVATALCVSTLLAVAAVGAPTVVLNEVAWAGTAAGGQDEWIELRNCSASAIDLTGWVLMMNDARIPLSVVEESTLEARRTTIDPNGFLLLERTDDTTVADIAADIVYKGALSNTGANLTLLDAAGNVIDQVRFVEAGWPAGSAAEGDLLYATMERVDPSEMGDVWRTNDGLVTYGLDAAGSPIQGTPRAANSATVAYLKTPRVQLVNPVAGDAACPVVVRWQAVDPDGAAAGLQISVSVRAVGVEEWTVLVDHFANQGDFAWDCASYAKGVEYEVRVAAVDMEGRAGTATSGAITLR